MGAPVRGAKESTEGCRSTPIAAQPLLGAGFRIVRSTVVANYGPKFAQDDNGDLAQTLDAVACTDGAMLSAETESQCGAVPRSAIPGALKGQIVNVQSECYSRVISNVERTCHTGICKTTQV